VVDGDEVFINGGIITPLALVFHELATNSTKYGALSDPNGPTWRPHPLQPMQDRSKRSRAARSFRQFR
jgi:two-component sensor histidine kinase